MTFEYEVLISAAGGDANLARELLQTLVEQIPTMIADFEAAISSNDSGKLRFVAHSLRGPLGSLGAKEAAELAARIEAMALKGEVNSAVAAAEQLRPELERLSADVSHFLETASV